MPTLPAYTAIKLKTYKSEKLYQKLKAKRAIRDYILQSEKAAKFYTGLSKCHQETVWNFLGAAKSQLKIMDTKIISGRMKSMCIESQFLLTFMILRRNRNYTDVAIQFNVSAQLVSRVFKTWLNFLYFKFGDMRTHMFTKKKDIQKPLPKAFQNNTLKDTRVVIDATEISVENTLNFKQQGNIYR